MNIAIDGPAGAGKSTIAKQLASALGFLYLDTGAMYRAVALKMCNNHIALQDEESVEKLLADTSVDVRHDNGTQKVYLDGKDVSTQIREPHISKAASDFSALPCVRLKLVQLQRAIAQTTDVILDGRDIGTYVLPDAKVKFFLTASVEERAKRRYRELQAKGANCNLDDIRKDIEVRDYNDSHRAFAPLKQADDAVLVDTTHLTISQVVEKMLQIIGEKR